jgi:hypothetical protein
MKKLLFLIFIVNLFAFTPKSINTKILITDSKYALISDINIQKGLTGYVIHDNKIIAMAQSLGKGKVKYIPFDSLKNNALATPIIMPKKDDKIIFGLYNKRSLVIAPNQEMYIETIKKHPNIKYVSSDLFSTYVDTTPNKKTFQNFCKDIKIGIIDFVLDKEYIVDCQSMHVLAKYTIIPKKYKRVFFSSYTKLTNSFFKSNPKNWTNYYKTLLKGINED